MRTTILLQQFCHMLGPLILVAGCIIYIARTGGVEGFIALMGSLGTLGLSATTTILTMLSMRSRVAGQDYARFMFTIQIGFLLASLTFAAGFIAIVLKARNRRESAADGAAPPSFSRM